MALLITSSILNISNFNSGFPFCESELCRTFSTNFPSLSFSDFIVARNLFLFVFSRLMFESDNASQANPIVAIGVLSSWVILFIKSVLICVFCFWL